MICLFCSRVFGAEPVQKPEEVDLAACLPGIAQMPHVTSKTVASALAAHEVSVVMPYMNKCPACALPLLSLLLIAKKLEENGIGVYLMEVTNDKSFAYFVCTSTLPDLYIHRIGDGLFHYPYNGSFKPTPMFNLITGIKCHSLNETALKFQPIFLDNVRIIHVEAPCGTNAHVRPTDIEAAIAAA